MYNAHVKLTGGYISGEVKLVITQHLFASRDSYELTVVFDVYSNYYNMIIYDVMMNWIINHNLVNLNMLKFLGDKTAMEKISKGFSARSNNVLIGAIGEFDG